jgi:hypothetical protein
VDASFSTDAGQAVQSEGMKLRHAAALVSIGWYLMVPPLQGPYTFLPQNLPLNRWGLHASFDTAAECQAYQGELVKEMQRKQRGKSKPTDADNVFASVAVYGRCIATDDPRLKGN